jgi:hypothetical protein
MTTPTAAQSGAIAGRVTWYDDGRPAEGVFVTAFGIFPPNEQRYTTTDRDGLYRITGLTPGDYAVEARPELPKAFQASADSGHAALIKMVVPKKELRALVPSHGVVQHDLGLWRP